MNCFMSLRHFFNDTFSILGLMLEDNATYEVIAWGAAIAIVSAFIIQTVRILISKSVSGISSYMYIMYSLAFAGWFTYGVHIESMSLIVSNLVIFFFTFVILILILYYDEEDKIERKYRDPLTRVYNKKYFEEKIPLMSADYLVTNKQFSVLAFTINNLDKISKKLGSKYANRALRALSRSLDKSLRETDVIARTDHNLFMVFLSDADRSIAERVTERLMNSFSNISIKKGKDTMNVDVLIGVCTWEYSDSLTEFGNKAFEALQSASMKKGNRVKYYEAKIKRLSSVQKVINARKNEAEKEASENKTVKKEKPKKETVTPKDAPAKKNTSKAEEPVVKEKTAKKVSKATSKKPVTKNKTVKK